MHLEITYGSGSATLTSIVFSISGTNYKKLYFLISGFDKEKTTLDELLEHFADHEPAVVNIQMRTYVDKRDKDKKRHFKVPGTGYRFQHLFRVFGDISSVFINWYGSESDWSMQYRTVVRCKLHCNPLTGVVWILIRDPVLF